MFPSRQTLHELYHGETARALRFQSVWLLFDVVLIAFFMASPFIERGTMFLVLDYAIALVLLLDLIARAWAFGDIRRWFMRPLVWADLAVLLSLVVPVYAANLGFLRVLRAYSLVNGRTFWRLPGRRWRAHEETIKAVVNLLIFVFMMASLVHTGFAARVPAIQSYMDSLYFTVTSLTTTGYGDITLPGGWGKAVSIVIMLGGVSLFFRLVNTTMRASKVRFPCPSCGLLRHDHDAVHCKACGIVLNIPNEGE